MSELSVIEQIRDNLEIQEPLKFFEHVKILDATTNQIIKYEMWPHLQEFISAIYDHQQVIVLKSKQVGVSWTLAALAVLWCMKVGSNVIMISKGEDEAVELLRKARFVYSQLPKYLQCELKDDAKTLLSFKHKQSRIHTLPSTEFAGVGETASLVIWDENEFHPNAPENWAHLKPTIDAGAKGVIVSTSNPPKQNSHFKILWRGARNGDNNFYPIFIPWTVVPNRTKDWLETVSKDYYLEWQVHADYPSSEEEALSPETGRIVFDGEILQKLLVNSFKEEEIRQGITHIWHRPRVGTQYIAGVDIAEGRGGDYSVLWLEGKEGLNRELCAIIHSNQILIDNFAYISYELLLEYYKPRVICGADPWGLMFLDALLALGYPRDKIYCSDEKREKLGYKESVKTRDTDLLQMEKALRDGVKIHYKPAIEEFFAFQIIDGKMQAAEGSHDDCVMAACRANFGFTQYKVDKQKMTISYPKSWKG